MTPWTTAHQAPLPMEFSRQEYSSGVPFPTPGHLPGPGLEPMSLVSPALAGGFFTTEPPGQPSLVVQWIKIHLPMKETQEMWVRSLGQEDPLEKEMATCSSILAWKIPWAKEPGGLLSMGHKESRHN